MRPRFAHHAIAQLVVLTAWQWGCSSDTGSPSPAAPRGVSAMGAGGATPSSQTSNSSGGTTSTASLQNQGIFVSSHGGLGQGSAVTSLGGQTWGGGRDGVGGTSVTSGTGENATGGSAMNRSQGGNVSGGRNNVGGRATGGSSPEPSTSGGNASGGSASSGGATNSQAIGGTMSGGTTGIAANGGTTNNPTAPVKIWIAGDSTVQNCSSACPCGWGGQFDALFNDHVTVANSAVGGRSIQTWLYDGNVGDTLGTNGECPLTSSTYNARWTAMTNSTAGMKAGDYLLIQFGINDGDRTCPRHVGATLYKAYLATMAQAAKAVGAHPIFLTPASAIACSGSNAVATRGFLDETKAAGAENDVPVIDLHQLTIDLYNQLSLCPNGEDYTSTTSALGRFFCADHTHFELAGAKQVAKVVAQAVRDQEIGLAAYLL